MKKNLIAILAIALIATTTGCNTNTSNTSTDSSMPESNISSDIHISEKATEKPTQKPTAPPTNPPTDPPTDPPYDVTPIVNDIKNGNYYSASTQINSLSYNDYNEEITSAFKAEVSSIDRLYEIFGPVLSTDAATMAVSDDVKVKWNDLLALYNSIASKSSENLVDYANYIANIIEYCSIGGSDFAKCMETFEYFSLSQTMLKVDLNTEPKDIISHINALQMYLNLYKNKFESTQDPLVMDYYNGVVLWGNGFRDFYNYMYANQTNIDYDAAVANIQAGLTQCKTVLETHQANVTAKMNLANTIFSTQKTLS